MTDSEEWRRVVGFGDEISARYEVSSLGRIRRAMDAPPTRGIWPGHIRKLQLRPDGYYGINLRTGTGYLNVLVHRVIALAFIPNPLSLPEVNHINRDRSDHRIENLEWVDRCDNMMHAFRTGAFVGRRNNFGDDHNFAKLRAEMIPSIRKRLSMGESQSSIARDFGITQTAVSAIHRRRNWAHIA